MSRKLDPIFVRQPLFIVADLAEKIAKRFGVNTDLSRAAGMLHDIADAVTSRFDPMHEDKSFEIARSFLEASEYSQEEINIIINDALKFHSCRKGKKPKTGVGKVLATADAVAHLTTDFYTYGTWASKGEKEYAATKDWAKGKIERDYKEKILFPAVKKEVKKDYEALRRIFAR